MTSGPEAGPADVAEALRQGVAPSALVAEAPANDVPAAAVPTDEAPTDEAPANDVPTDEAPAADDLAPLLDSPGQTVAAAGVTVHITGAAIGASGDVFGELAESDVVAALAAKDSSRWGPTATAEASVRLGWLDAPTSSRPLIDRIDTLRDDLRAEGLDHVVLAGVGGSALAAEVIARSAGAMLTVVDTTDPGQLGSAIRDRIERTVLVVASKSGATVEIDCARRIYLQAFAEAGLSPAQAARRIVVVTDPDSLLAELAAADGYREVFFADPDVGGRYSALSAYGLVPAGLAGADVAALLDTAAALAPALAMETDNPGLALGSALGGGALSGHDKVVLADAGGGADADAGGGFADWAEQLLAESTGKDGKGLLPVVVESTTAAGFSPAADTRLVAVVAGDAATDAVPPTFGAADITVSGPLGAQFLLWEYATAVAGVALRINPFDQPNVAESKANTEDILANAGDGPPVDGKAALVEGAVEVYDETGVLGTARDLAGALSALLAAVPAEGYLAVLAFLDRETDADAAQLRPILASRLAHPVTFGWGPRYLHSTGQYHKGGTQVGVFLQLTGAVTVDLDVPGRDFPLGRLQAAQALGDLRALNSRGRPAVRLHLRDRAVGLAQVLAAARAVSA